MFWKGASSVAEQFYKIGEFARLIGVSSATLRAWDDRGLLRPHHISPSGYRYYSTQQLRDYLSGERVSESAVSGGDADEGSR